MTSLDALSSYNLSALKNYSLPALPQTNAAMGSLFQSPDIYNMAVPMDTYANVMPMFPSMKDNFSGFSFPQLDGVDLTKLWEDSLNMMKMQIQTFMSFSKLNNNFELNTTPNAKLKDINYDALNAKSIASNALSRAGSKSKKRCAEYVSNAIANSGLSVARGDAYEMENNLRKSSEFKEITVSKSELASLPAGCILVYPRGVAGYSSKYGHIEVTLGDGRTASDFVNNNPKYAQEMKVFVPVAA